MNAPAHGALVRGDDGNLHLRRFATAEQAAEASRHLQDPMPVPSLDEVELVMGKRRGTMRSTEMARRLQVHPRTIRRAYENGWLPGAKEHGPRILEVPVHLYRLAEAYGLRGLERMVKARMVFSDQRRA